MQSSRVLATALLAATALAANAQPARLLPKGAGFTAPYTMVLVDTLTYAELAYYKKIAVEAIENGQSLGNEISGYADACERRVDIEKAKARKWKKAGFGGWGLALILLLI